MRVLLDENLPSDLARELTGHDVDTVSGLGWQGLKNGELLRSADRRFDAFLTMDRGIEFQQNVAALSFRVVLVQAPSNRRAHLRPLVPTVLRALEEAGPGELRRVGTAVTG